MADIICVLWMRSSGQLVKVEKEVDLLGDDIWEMRIEGIPHRNAVFRSLAESTARIETWGECKLVAYYGDGWKRLAGREIPMARHRMIEMDKTFWFCHKTEKEHICQHQLA